jgi:hypothetical protein
MKKRFQSLLSLSTCAATLGIHQGYSGDVVGCCTSKRVNTRVESASAWFQRLKLKCDRLLSSLAFKLNLRAYNVEAEMAIHRQGLTDNARHAIQRTFNPRFLIQMAPSDVASSIFATSSNALWTLVS